jgi:negative regulator of flagellin synthesis FlgM
MKIGQFEPKGTPPQTSAKVDRKTGGTEASGVEPSARVELSAASALAAAAGDASFDAGKVDRISGEIRNGSYHVDAGVIADKLIANAQELIARGKR